MKVKVNGMMCEHCEAHVKEVLEAVDGIEDVVASHEENMVTITASKAIDDATIKVAIEKAGYGFAGVVG
ncbi:MAG: heavy-metal-associated domain-containing protein [Lachnospiraceae bacterium]|nr:heavy-metal-associated domain-containing protein [Lachnospiraceae bacterium]